MKQTSPTVQSVMWSNNDNVTAGIAEPVLLFSKDYDAVTGKLADFMPTEAPASKCPALPRRKAAMAVSSPAKAFVTTTATAVHIVANY